MSILLVGGEALVAAPALVVNAGNGADLVILQANGWLDSQAVPPSVSANVYASIDSNPALLNSGNTNASLAFSVDFVDGRIIKLRHRYFGALSESIYGFDIISGDGSTLLYNGAVRSNNRNVGDAAIPSGGSRTIVDPHDGSVWRLEFNAATSPDSQDLVSNISSSPDGANDWVDTLTITRRIDDPSIELDAITRGPEILTDTPTNFDITLTNSGSAGNLVVSSVTLAEGDSSHFTILTNLSSPLSIAPGSSVPLTVEFDPDGEKRDFATRLTLQTNSGETPTVNTVISAAYRDSAALPDKVDLLFVHAHSDDEGLFGGGVLPYYAQYRRLKIASLILVTRNANGRDPILANNGADRLQELRRAHDVYAGRPLQSGTYLSTSKAYITGNIVKIEGGLTDTGCCDGNGSPDDSWSQSGDGYAWGASSGVTLNSPGYGNYEGIIEGRYAAAKQVARQIRRFKPKVVVTCHDLEGDYGHSNHIATAIATIEGYALAADAQVEIDGLPAWQAKKLFVRGDGNDNRQSIVYTNFTSTGGLQNLLHDAMEEPTDSGLTSRQIATNGLKQHVSQGGANFSASSIFQSGESFDGHHSEWWTLYSSEIGSDPVASPFTLPGDTTGTTYTQWARGDFFQGVTAFPDRDGDALPDDWELVYFLSLTAAHPNGDSDVDGVTNLEEYILGTHPGVADSASPVISADGLEITFTPPAETYDSVVTRRWRLCWSADLSDWSTVLLSGVGDDVPRTYQIGSGGEATDSSFYRLEYEVK